MRALGPTSSWHMERWRQLGVRRAREGTGRTGPRLCHGQVPTGAAPARWMRVMLSAESSPPCALSAAKWLWPGTASSLCVTDPCPQGPAGLHNYVGSRQLPLVSAGPQQLPQTWPPSPTGLQCGAACIFWAPVSPCLLSSAGSAGVQCRKLQCGCQLPGCWAGKEESEEPGPNHLCVQGPSSERGRGRAGTSLPPVMPHEGAEQQPHPKERAAPSTEHGQWLDLVQPLGRLCPEDMGALCVSPELISCFLELLLCLSPAVTSHSPCA